MSEPEKNPSRRRVSKVKHTVKTKSGKTLRVNQSLGGKIKARRDEKARAKAAYLATLPKERWKRILYRLHPKRVAKYWFSKKGALMALKITGIGIVAVFVLMVAVFAYFRKDLPKLDDINSSDFGGSVVYYDRTGQTVLWEDYESFKRVPVKYDQMSSYLRAATIATEDKNFYNHGAFDVSGIVRAGLNDVFGSGGRQGGSTITQQLVKLDQAWTNDQTYARKVKELILAVDLEREYSKDDIITGYLNLAPYGPVQNGVETGAQDYFGVSAKDVTIAQAAFLAAIPKSPDYYSPYGGSYDAEALEGRIHYILDRMAEQNDKNGKPYITKKQAEDAKKEDILATVKPRPTNLYADIKAPYFVLAAKAELEQKRGSAVVKRGGLKVITTLDLKLQTEAETQVAAGMRQITRQGGDTAAFAASDVETGQMVALVGGPGFDTPGFGQNNYAQIPLPPGSSFKPYDYAALIEHGTNVGAGSVLYDVQAPLPGYSCTNKNRPTNGGNCLFDYDFHYPGPVTLRYALGGSRNVPAVKAMGITGVDKTIETAEKMGLASGYKCFEDESQTIEATCGLSAAIGDGAYLSLDEHVNAHATFSRMGNYVPRTYLLKVTDSNEKTLIEWQQPAGTQAIRPDTAYIIADIMSDPNASYLGNKIQSYKNWKFAVKTGTTNDSKDGLMLGYSTKYAAGVWVGYHDRTVEMSGFMENMTTPIWNGWMKAAHADLPAKNWDKPADVKTDAAFVLTSRPASGGSARVPSPATDLYPSWYKPNAATGSAAQAIDKVSGRIATSCTPELAKENRLNANANKFSIDTFMGAAAGNTMSEQDNIHKCEDAKPLITMTSPASCNTASSNCNFTITVSQGTHAFSSDKFGGKVNLVVNGQVVKTIDIPAGTGSSFSTTVNYAPTASGAYTIAASVSDSVLYQSSSENATTTFTVTP